MLNVNRGKIWLVVGLTIIGAFLTGWLGLLIVQVIVGLIAAYRMMVAGVLVVAAISLVVLLNRQRVRLLGR